MTDEILLALETAAPVAGTLQNIDDLVRIMSREMALAVKGMTGSGQQFEGAWRRIVLEVAKGRNEEMHAVRAGLIGALEKRLQLLKESHALASWLRKLGRADVPDADVLLAEIVLLERLKSAVFDPWQTAEDLEDLAAKDFPLTTTELERIGPLRQPPQAFYAEESKPF